MIELVEAACRLRARARENELRAIHESDQGDELAALAFRTVACALLEVAESLDDEDDA